MHIINMFVEETGAVTTLGATNFMRPSKPAAKLGILAFDSFISSMFPFVEIDEQNELAFAIR